MTWEAQDSKGAVLWDGDSILAIRRKITELHDSGDLTQEPDICNLVYFDDEGNEHFSSQDSVLRFKANIREACHFERYIDEDSRRKECE